MSFLLHIGILAEQSRGDPTHSARGNRRFIGDDDDDDDSYLRPGE
jgi:hypothetical protein